MNFLKAAKRIGRVLSSKAPIVWDGRRAILEMKDAGYPHWKQMEWIGFYFQFLCEKHLSGFVRMPGPTFGRVRFDGLMDIPWDFKAHAINTSSHQIIVNDSQATADAIAMYGLVGLVLALGRVEYNDAERAFQQWHQELKGGKSRYEIERIRRGAWSRLRKISFHLQQISFLKIGNETLVRCGSFQRDFRNSNGMPRREKVLIDLEKIDDELAYFVEF